MVVSIDVVQGPGASAAAVANRVKIGTITLPAWARGLLRVWATVAPVGTFAANKPVIGSIQLESTDIDLEPFEFPIEPIAGYLTLGGGGPAPAHKWIVNAKAIGQAKIDAYMVADIAPNAAPEVQVNFEFTDGSPGGQQLRMKAAEPAVTQSTSDNGETSLTDITELMKRIYRVWTYAVATTPIVDSSTCGQVEITSSDFAEVGPLNFSFNPHIGGDADTPATRTELTTVEVDRGFKSPAAKSTISARMIVRDAQTTGPTANWGIVFV